MACTWLQLRECPHHKQLMPLSCMPGYHEPLAVPFSASVLQLLLVMGVLEHTSVFLLLCWVLVVPLLLGVTRVADVARKRWLLPLDGKQLPCLAVAAAGLGEQDVTGTHAAAMLSSSTS